MSLISSFLIILMYYNTENDSILQIILPIQDNTIINIGILYIFLLYFTLLGSSNAVNLTDGLDGLAIFPVLCVTLGLCLLSFISGNMHYSKYFNIIYIHKINELAVFCTAIIGSGLGFLWFNAYPAQIFMGDSGSLSLGGAIGTISILLHQEVIFFIMSGIFVIETLSVIVQVSYFKFSKKRIFKMAPIHHHYELKGYPEPKLIIRFWIISIIFTLFGLVSIFKVN